jgi:tetratricopeptide (TPR) repeat protein
MTEENFMLDRELFELTSEDIKYFRHYHLLLIGQMQEGGPALNVEEYSKQLMMFIPQHYQDAYNAVSEQIKKISPDSKFTMNIEGEHQREHQQLLSLALAMQKDHEEWKKYRKPERIILAQLLSISHQQKFNSQQIHDSLMQPFLKILDIGGNLLRLTFSRSSAGLISNAAVILSKPFLRHQNGTDEPGITLKQAKILFNDMYQDNDFQKVVGQFKLTQEARNFVVDEILRSKVNSEELTVKLKKDQPTLSTEEINKKIAEHGESIKKAFIELNEKFLKNEMAMIDFFSFLSQKSNLDEELKKSPQGSEQLSKLAVNVFHAGSQFVLEHQALHKITTDQKKFIANFSEFLNRAKVESVLKSAQNDRHVAFNTSLSLSYHSSAQSLQNPYTVETIADLLVEDILTLRKRSQSLEDKNLTFEQKIQLLLGQQELLAKKMRRHHMDTTFGTLGSILGSGSVVASYFNPAVGIGLELGSVGAKIVQNSKALHYQKKLDRYQREGERRQGAIHHFQHLQLENTQQISSLQVKLESFTHQLIGLQSIHREEGIKQFIEHLEELKSKNNSKLQEYQKKRDKLAEKIQKKRKEKEKKLPKNSTTHLPVTVADFQLMADIIKQKKDELTELKKKNPHPDKETTKKIKELERAIELQNLLYNQGIKSIKHSYIEITDALAPQLGDLEALNQAVDALTETNKDITKTLSRLQPDSEEVKKVSGLVKYLDEQKKELSGKPNLSYDEIKKHFEYYQQNYLAPRKEIASSVFNHLSGITGSLQKFGLIASEEELATENTTFALSEFSSEDVKNLIELIGLKFSKIQLINPQDPAYKKISFTQQEFDDVKAKLHKQNDQRVKTLSEKLVNKKLKFSRTKKLFSAKNLNNLLTLGNQLTQLYLEGQTFLHFASIFNQEIDSKSLWQKLKDGGLISISTIGMPLLAITNLGLSLASMAFGREIKSAQELQFDRTNKTVVDGFNKLSLGLVKSFEAVGVELVAIKEMIRKSDQLQIEIASRLDRYLSGCFKQLHHDFGVLGKMGIQLDSDLTFAIAMNYKSFQLLSHLVNQVDYHLAFKTKENRILFLKSALGIYKADISKRIEKNTQSFTENSRVMTKKEIFDSSELFVELQTQLEGAKNPGVNGIENGLIDSTEQTSHKSLVPELLLVAGNPENFSQYIACHLEIGELNIANLNLLSSTLMQWIKLTEQMQLQFDDESFEKLVDHYNNQEILALIKPTFRFLSQLTHESDWIAICLEKQLSAFKKLYEFIHTQFKLPQAIDIPNGSLINKPKREEVEYFCQLYANRLTLVDILGRTYKREKYKSINYIKPLKDIIDPPDSLYHHESYEYKPGSCYNLYTYGSYFSVSETHYDYCYREERCSALWGFRFYDFKVPTVVDNGHLYIYYDSVEFSKDLSPSTKSPAMYGSNLKHFADFINRIILKYKNHRLVIDENYSVASLTQVMQENFESYYAYLEGIVNPKEHHPLYHDQAVLENSVIINSATTHIPFIFPRAYLESLKKQQTVQYLFTIAASRLGKISYQYEFKKIENYYVLLLYYLFRVKDAETKPQNLITIQVAKFDEFTVNTFLELPWLEKTMPEKYKSNDHANTGINIFLINLMGFGASGSRMPTLDSNDFISVGKKKLLFPVDIYFPSFYKILNCLESRIFIFDHLNYDSQAKDALLQFLEKRDNFALISKFLNLGNNISVDLDKYSEINEIYLRHQLTEFHQRRISLDSSQDYLEIINDLFRNYEVALAICRLLTNHQDDLSEELVDQIGIFHPSVVDARETKDLESYFEILDVIHADIDKIDISTLKSVFESKNLIPKSLKQISDFYSLLEPYFLIQSRDKIDAGEFDTAITILKDLIKLNPNKAKYHHYLGICASEQGDYKGAIKHYDEAIELNPEKASYFARRGCLKQKLNFLDEALNDYMKAIGLALDNPELLSQYRADYQAIVRSQNSYSQIYLSQATEQIKSLGVSFWDRTKAEEKIQRSDYSQSSKPMFFQ